jgi:hypothetical protein
LRCTLDVESRFPFEFWKVYLGGGGEDEEKLDFLELLGLGVEEAGAPPLLLMASLLG